MPTAAIIGTGLLGTAVSSRNQRRAADRAASAQTEGQQAALEAAREAAERARADAIPLFSSGQQNVLAGFDAARQLMGESIPEQIRAFQGGNIAAQNVLQAGLPQMQNAILGGPINNAALQTTRLQAPLASLFDRALPNFQTIEQALPQGQTNPQDATTGPNPFFNFLTPTTGIPSNPFATGPGASAPTGFTMPNVAPNIFQTGFGGVQGLTIPNRGG